MHARSHKVDLTHIYVMERFRMSIPNRAASAILVVDDVTEMREMVLRLLRVMGFGPLFAAKSGEDAATLLHDQRFALVLCDWNMPGMTGLEVLQKVREAEGGESIPFIMVTGENHREKIEAAIAAGVTDYLLKPFNAVTLESKITLALTRMR